jgi:hypothetical protein
MLKGAAMNQSGRFIAIAALCVTAVLLGCTLALIEWFPVPEVQAGHSPDRQGDYIMLPGARVQGDEVVYLIDVPARKLIAYSADPNNNRVVVHAIFDLATLKSQQ